MTDKLIYAYVVCLILFGIGVTVFLPLYPYSAKIVSCIAGGHQVSTDNAWWLDPPFNGWICDQHRDEMHRQWSSK